MMNFALMAKFAREAVDLFVNEYDLHAVLQDLRNLSRISLFSLS